MYLFNHCTVAIFRLTDLIEAINEMFKIGCNGIAFTFVMSHFKIRLMSAFVICQKSSLK